MSVFYQEEPPIPSKKCKFLAVTLKDAFSHCHTFGGRYSTSSPEKEYPASDFDDEQEEVVSEIRSRAMEKLRNKPCLARENFSWVFSAKTGELYITQKAVQPEEDDHHDEGDERDEFFSVGSRLSRCSSAVSREAFHTVRTNFSRSSSLNDLDFQEFWRPDIQYFQRRSMIQEFRHCEGWPFGLCRKAVLLPPLPKSPSESWTWSTKGGRVVKMPSA